MNPGRYEPGRYVEPLGSKRYANTAARLEGRGARGCEGAGVEGVSGRTAGEVGKRLRRNDSVGDTPAVTPEVTGRRLRLLGVGVRAVCKTRRDCWGCA